MGKVQRGLISCTYIFISLSFGIIFLLMLFTIFKNINTTGYVYIKGIFDFIFANTSLSFFLFLLMGSFLIFVSDVNPMLVKTVTVLTFVILLHDLPPLKALIEDMQAGVPIGIPWTALLMAIHVILFTVLAGTWRALETSDA